MFNFELNKKSVIDALTKVEPITRKSLYTLLGCVRIDVGISFVTFSTSDISIHIFETVKDVETSVDQIDGYESVFVNASQILKIIKTAKPNETISFECIEIDDKDKLIIQTERSRYTLETHSITKVEMEYEWDYFNMKPTIDQFVMGTSINLYNDAIDKVGFACELKDTVRVAFMGIFFEITESNVILTATNGKILANKALGDMGNITKTQKEKDVEFILPGAALPHIKRCLKTTKSDNRGDENIDFFLMGRGERIALHHNNGIIFVNAINGDYKFPEWRQLLYIDKNKNNIVFDVQSFKDAVKDVMALEHSNYSVLGIRIQDKKGHVKSVSEGVGEVISSFEVLSAINDENDEWLARFNYELIKDSLNKIETKSGLIRYGEPGKFIILQPVSAGAEEYINVLDETDLDYQCMVMPVESKYYDDAEF